MEQETIITLFTDAEGSRNSFQTWDSQLLTVLRGSLEITSKGRIATFEDRYSESRVVLTAQDGRAQKIEVFLPDDPKAPSVVERTTLIEFGEDAPTRKVLFNGFRDYFQGSGETDDGVPLIPLTPLFPRKTEFVTEGSVEPDGPRDIGARVVGFGDDDLFRLNDGTHSIIASTGDDTINGGGGTDGVIYSFGSFGGLTLTKSGGAVIIDKGQGNGQDTLRNVESLTATPEDDNLSKGLSNNSTAINGGAGNDKIGGRRGDDVLDGSQGNDTVLGRGGNDILIGGDGLDKIRGGSGNDVLVAGSGFGGERANDVLIGQGGKDLYLLETSFFSFNPDPTEAPVVTIKGFKPGEDFIGLPGRISTTDSFGGDAILFKDLDMSLQGGDTLISLVEEPSFADQEPISTPLALLKKVTPDEISRDDFVEAVDVNQTIFGNNDVFFF